MATADRLPAQRTPQLSLIWWLSAFGVFASAELLVPGLFTQDAGMDPAPLLLFGLSTALFGGAWLPITDIQKPSWINLCCWLAGLTLVFSICALVQFDTPPAAAFKLTVAVSLLLALCSATKLWLVHRSQSQAHAQVTYLCLLAGLIAAPVILSPLAESFAQQAWVGNLVIAMSPYSYLASWIDHDYLRDPWFYQNTAYGGLRFSYPSVVILSSVYLVATALFLRCADLRDPPGYRPTGQTTQDGEHTAQPTLYPSNLSPNFNT
jgi:hypothetical protein